MGKRNRRARSDVKKSQPKGVINKPETDSQGDQAQKDKILAPSPAVGFSNSPTPTSQTQRDPPTHKNKYSKYIMGPLIAVRHYIATKLISVFGILDRHSGSITALATIAIVILTWFYVSYSKKQWETTRDALVAGQRPWVGLNDEQAALQTTPITIDDKLTAHIQFRITAKNFGAAGAQGVFPMAHLKITQDISNLYDWEVASCRERIPEHFGAVLFAGKLNISSEFPDLAEQKYWIRNPSSTSTEFQAWMVGCVSYADVFGLKHHTGFSYRLSENGGGVVFSATPQTIQRGAWGLHHSFFLD